MTSGVPPTYTQLSSALADRYRLERELGSGGMATVYLAEDVRHKRRIALKVLHPELSAVLGAERFLKEIELTANLQHPHILPLFDSGSADGQLFYVMPFVDGETLRARLERETQLPLDDALRIAREVADALAYAHERGVIHRDIKPENILLQGGHALVADFGIALAVQQAGGQRMTQTGLSLGTPQYMAPEQAAGEKTVDSRADVYALAAVLYEMLAGEPPFTGPTAQAIVARVLTAAPASLTETRSTVPTHVDQAVLKALAKLPADRFTTTREFAEALVHPTFTAQAEVPARTGRAGTRKQSWPLVAMSVVTMAALGVAVWAWRGHSQEVAGIPVRFQLTVPPDVQIANRGIAISPDGKSVVIRATRGGSAQLYIRTLNDSIARPVPGTDQAGAAFYSHDGEWLVFIVDGRLKKVRPGAPVVSLDVDGTVNGGPTWMGATWTNKSVIVLGNQLAALSWVSATGGTRKTVAPLDTLHGETSQRWPLALDDGETVLYGSMHGPNTSAARIAVASLARGTTRSLDLQGTLPLAVLSGQLIYATAAGTIMAAPFDARSARVSGPATPVLEGVDVTGTGYAAVAVSRSGSLVYQSGKAASQLVLADLKGSMRVLAPEPKVYTFPRFSPDGKRFAVAIASPTTTDIWIYDVATGTPARFTNEGFNDRAEWTPDGKRVLFRRVASTGDRATLWWQSADGSGHEELLKARPGHDVQEAIVSRDGQTLIFRVDGKLWRQQLRRGGDTTSTPFSTNAFSELGPRISPDGHWIAYSSNRTGSTQVYVQPFPELGALYTITAGGGETPVWSPDGHRLYFVANGQLSVAAIETTPSFRVVSLQVVLESPFVFNNSNHAMFDVSPDGQHFLLMKPMRPAETMVVHDWKYELRDRTKKP